MAWGGDRKGAGAKLKYHESTVVMRVPKSMALPIKQLSSMALLKTSTLTPLQLPLMGSRISAGFPSPADDYIETRLDLNDYVIKHPAGTFYARLGKQADSMIGAGIYPGDLIVIDRTLTAKQGDIVLAVINGEFTLKRYKKVGKIIMLVAEHPDYPSIQCKEGDDLHIWGVVKHSIRDF